MLLFSKYSSVLMALLSGVLFPLLRCTFLTAFLLPSRYLSFATAFSWHGKLLCVFDPQRSPSLIAITKESGFLLQACSLAVTGGSS